ncbi:MAG: FAD-dependent oxidoreductase, partial [Verrucomicrobiales bacterium]|nr:FAD-dependent oxidoreductase [Verrucomicrobiales bacterium]
LLPPPSPSPSFVAMKPLLLALLSLSGSLAATERPTYDLVIYGGTSAGFTAAIQAAKLGKSVVLLEPTAHIGGINIEGLGGTDIDNHREFQNSPAVGGLALEFYRRIAHAYGRQQAFDAMLAAGKKEPALWRFEPHVAEQVIQDWLREYAVDQVTQAPLREDGDAVIKDGSRLLRLVTDQGEFAGKMFLDATIEGDLLAAAGVSTVIGRESNAQYGETKNGIRAETTHQQFNVAVDPWRVPGNAASGLLTGILDEPLGQPGAADHRLQAYCFRVCLTDQPANQIPLPQPPDYDRADYELPLRYLKAGGKLYQPHATLPNQKTDLNGGSVCSHNLNGMNYGYPGGSRAERRKILEHHRHYTQGLFWFLAHDAEVGQIAPDLQQAWARWGLAKDEFTDNAGWPRQFYVRDARRMVSDHVITEHHMRKVDPLPVEDPVAMAFWPPDVHNVRTIVQNGRASNEGFVFGGNDWIPFGISYRALVPKAAEATNLLTPTCPSSSHIAYGAIRIEFTFMALGQACAVAAAQALDAGLPVQKLPYPPLRAQLLQDGQVLTLSSKP